MPFCIIVGPEAMYVERNGVRSETAPLTEQDGPQEVRAKAADLAKTIVRLVAFGAWLSHRITMARQRARAAHVMHVFPGPYFRGLGPDLVATRPWKAAVKGQWTMLPHGVVARLLRQNPVTNHA